MESSGSSVVLDREQLREITLEDPDLMRDVLAALIEDTAVQLGRLGQAIRDQDGEACVRLAHYSKGACANIGACRITAVLKEMEQQARGNRFLECGESLERLASELDLLRNERL